MDQTPKHETAKSRGQINQRSSQVWQEHDSDDENTNTNTDYVSSIKSNPDYLFRLIRLNINTNQQQLFDAIDQYLLETSSLPFDDTGRVFSNNDSNEVASISLLEPLYNQNRLVLLKFIGKYCVELTPNLFTFLSQKVGLLRLFVTNFPSWFENCALPTTTNASTIALCQCQETPQQEIPQNHFSCFCQAQSQLMLLNYDIESNDIESILESSMKQFGCLPCDIHGKIPISISYQPRQVQINYVPDMIIHELLISSSQYQIAGKFLLIIKGHSAINQALSTYSDWDSDAQYGFYLSIIDRISKSIVFDYLKPQSIAQKLFALESMFDNWYKLWSFFIQNHQLSQLKPLKSLQQIQLTQQQQSTFDAFESLLFSYIASISRRFDTHSSKSKQMKISSEIYNMLCHLLQLQTKTGPNSTLTDPLLQHIFAFYLPYLCPYHISVIQYVLPISTLQEFHPSSFCHFNKNYQKFILQSAATLELSTTPTTPTKINSQSKTIDMFTNQRINNSQSVSSNHIHFSLFHLKIHPISLLAAFISPFQFNFQQHASFPQPITISANDHLLNPTPRNFSCVPLFVHQIHQSLNRHYNISPFIDPHLDVGQTNNLQTMLSNILPKVDLSIVQQPKESA
jgi:hypothetical protein